MELTILNISKLAGVTRKTVYRALRGGATRESLMRIQNAIFKITGKKIAVNEISMGQYSTNVTIKNLCDKKYKTNVINNFYETCCYADVYDAYDCTSFDDHSDQYLLL